MRLGISLPIVQQVPGRAAAWEAEADVEALVRVATAADRLGFAWISCSDHVAVPQSYAATMGPVWYEPVATLSFLAARTTRIGLLSHVVVLPYRHPLLMAKSFATLDRLCGGRVIVGVGAGHLKPEFRSLALDYERRGQQSDEALAALTQALENECSSFTGEFAAWRDMVVAPRAVRQPRPPVWVGGNGRTALRRAARSADGWIPWQLELAEFRQRVEFLHSLERPSGDFAVIAPAALRLGEAAADLGARLEAWTDAGASGFHLGIESRSLGELLERLESVAQRVSLDP